MAAQAFGPHVTRIGLQKEIRRGSQDQFQRLTARVFALLNSYRIGRIHTERSYLPIRVVVEH